MKKAISAIAVILSLTMLLASCTIGGKDDPSATPTPPPSPNPELTKNTVNASIILEDGGVIELELYPDLAPETVQNFVELAEDGFYDGTIFHRVIEGFMIQGGGYDENLRSKKADTIFGEFAMNGFENELAHVRGVISMARAQDVNSASSQFFIVQQDATYLDGQYAAFGRVTEGMDVVDEIASERTGSVASQGMEDVPVDPIVIETITINSGSTDSSSAKSSKSSKKSSSKDDDDDKDLPSFLDDEDEDDDVKATTKPSSSKKSSSSSKDDDDEPIAKFFEEYNSNDL